MIKNLAEFLRKKTTRPVNTNPEENLNNQWLAVKAIENRKKDIAWRLFHRALPLGYQLRHINPEENGDCTWCIDELQTIKHFIIDCRISQEIWKTAYSFLNTGQAELPPKTVEEIFDVSNIKNEKGSQAALWLHINTVYEIWCQYTRVKWREEYQTLTGILNIVKCRLNKEVKILQHSLKKFTSKKKENLYKFLRHEG